MRNRAAPRALRFALVLLLGTALARTGSASDVEIPQKLLDYEARVRASFTPAQRSRQAALEARVSSKMSVQQVLGLMEGSSDSGEIMACLMKYLKDCAKEIKENRTLKEEFMRQSLAAKARKLDQENAYLATSMREAAEKAEIAMRAATTGMVVGIAQGLIQIGAAAASYAGTSAGAHAGAAGKAPASPSGSVARAAAAPGLVVPTRTPTKAPSGVTKAP